MQINGPINGPRRRWKVYEKNEFKKAFKAMLKSHSKKPIIIRENISNRDLCKMYQENVENKYSFWVELAKLLPKDIDRNSDQCQTFYKNTFKRALSDESVNPLDKLYMLEKIFMKCFIENIDQSIVNNELRKYFRQKRGNVFINDIDTWLSRSWSQLHMHRHTNNTTDEYEYRRQQLLKQIKRWNERHPEEQIQDVPEQVDGGQIQPVNNNVQGQNNQDNANQMADPEDVNDEILDAMLFDYIQ